MLYYISEDWNECVSVLLQCLPPYTAPRPGVHRFGSDN